MSNPGSGINGSYGFGARYGKIAFRIWVPALRYN
jgi:hypothetical protein